MECTQVTNSYCEAAETAYSQIVSDEAALRGLKLRLDNLGELEALRRVINEEEEKTLSVDEVLARVIEFYGRFVPYKTRAG